MSCSVELSMKKSFITSEQGYVLIFRKIMYLKVCHSLYYSQFTHTYNNMY